MTKAKATKVLRERKGWLSAAEWAQIPMSEAFPRSKGAVHRLIESEGWAIKDKRQGRGGGWQYHWTNLQGPARDYFIAHYITAVEGEALAKAQEPPPKPAPKSKRAKNYAEKLAEMERRWAQATDDHRAIAHFRLDVLLEVNELRGGGLTKNDACDAIVSRHEAIAHTLRELGKDDEANTHEFTRPTIYAWYKLISGVQRAHWELALVPRWRGNPGKRVEVDAEFEQLFEDLFFARPPKPFNWVFYQVEVVAQQKGWEIPNLATFRRRMKEKHPPEVWVLKRGSEVDFDAIIMPSKRRDVGHLIAHQGLVMDGHDVPMRIEWPDGEVNKHATLLSLRDIFSGDIVAYIFAKTESALAVRGLFARYFREHGKLAPERFARMDNGPAWTAKEISGEVVGLLRQLGFRITKTIAYNAKAKSVERDYRDYHQQVWRDPRLKTGYLDPGLSEQERRKHTGKNRLEKVIEVFEEYLELQRRRPSQAAACKGRSRMQARLESEKENAALYEQMSEAQVAMTWLARTQVTCSRHNAGEIRLNNATYWTPECRRHMGERLIAGYWPEAINTEIYLFDQAGRHLFKVPVQDRAPDDSKSHTQEFNRAKAIEKRAARKHAEATLRRRDLEAQRTVSEATKAMAEADAAGGMERDEDGVLRPAFGLPNSPTDDLPVAGVRRTPLPELPQGRVIDLEGRYLEVQAEDEYDHQVDLDEEEQQSNYLLWLGKYMEGVRAGSGME